MDMLIAAIFGWPAVIVAVILLVVGFARGRYGFVLGAAVSATPFLLYLSMTPAFRWQGIPVAVLLFGAAAAAARRHQGIALAMTVPFVALAGFVAWSVFGQ